MFEFALPDLGEGVAEGEILEWHVDVGDTVSEDDVLLEVETDKAAVEVPSPVDGTIAERHGEAGDVVETGSIIVTIDTEEDVEEGADVDGQETDGAEAVGEAAAAESGGEGAERAADAGATGNGQRVFAPPSVRRLARELGVAVGDVSGSGPSGRVTEDDVRAAAEGSTAESSTAESSTAESSTAESSAAEGSEEADAAATGSEADDDAPKSAIRRISEDESADEAGAGAKSGTGDEPAVRSAVRSTKSEASRERTLATPATRRLARELGVDVDAVPTDLERDGEPFVDEGAVRAFAERRESDAAASEVTAATSSDASTDKVGAAAAGDAVGDAAGETAAAETGDAGVGTGNAGDETADAADLDVSVARTEEYRGIRRRIGERMAQSRREVPHATHHDRVEVSELVAARDRLKPLAEDRGVNLTYTPFILKCVGAALEEHPVLNTRIDVDAEAIHYLDEYNVGVATDTERGLLVPVVRDVDDRGIMELAEATNDVVSRARDGSIKRDEMQGGTFTVTNVGAIGGEYADPVINVPQTAVLAVGSLRERPVAVDGEVAAEPTLPLSLAIDHRVIDGADAARFTNTLKSYLADPTRLLLE